MAQRMHYFYMHNDARTDAKLATLADDEHRVWLHLLCLASDNQEQRGTVEMPLYLLAIEAARSDVTLLSRAVTHLSRLNIVTVTGCHDGEDDAAIVQINFVNFAKRNARKPSDDPTATAQRKREQRERDRSNTAKTTEATPQPKPRHALSRAVTPSHGKSRIDKSREDKSREEENISLIGADAPPKPRERNPHWDALSEGLGFTPTTKTEKSRFGKVTIELAEAGVTPDQIRAACENYSTHFEGAARTPEAILKHISQLQTPKVRSNGHAANRRAYSETRLKVGAAGSFGDGGYDSWSDEPDPFASDYPG